MRRTAALHRSGRPILGTHQHGEAGQLATLEWSVEKAAAAQAAARVWRRR